MIFKNNYYCFVASLPEVSWDDRKLGLTVDGFREMAEESLSKQDMELVNLFFLPADNTQVFRLLNKMVPDTELKTVYPLQLLEEEINEPSGILPSYLTEYIRDFKDDRLKYSVSSENVLSWMYYDYMLNSENEFVRQYAEFSMNVKNLIAALNSRKYKRDIAKEVIGSNEFSNAIRTSSVKDFGLSDFSYVEKVTNLLSHDDLVEREKSIDLLAWDFIEDSVIFDYFTIEKVLSILLELMIVERWSKMTSESGRKVFMEIVDRFRKNFEFTDDFK